MTALSDFPPDVQALAQRSIRRDPRSRAITIIANPASQQEQA